MASARPLRRKAVRWYIVRDFLLFYPSCVVFLRFVGYHSYYPHFHRVRESIHQAILEAIPLALLGVLLSYFALLRGRDWL